jgi:serine/threonine-protein kinase
MEAPLSSRETARRFHFLREIASGGFGTVYLTKVMHADGFSRLVAVKLLKSQWTDSDEVARRMRDEARLLGLLRHRHIVDVMDLTAIDGRAAVVMEYLEAVDLKHIVKRLAAEGGRLPVRAVLEIGAAVASALDAAYNRPPIPGDKPLRVIHRDIKPSNIMVDETGMVKVLDFGVARSEIENRESHTQDLQFGSVDYMAPERLFFEPETPASDVYSLGATLYELIALDKLGKGRGRPALHRKAIAERLERIGPALAAAGPHAADVRALLEQSLVYEHESRPTAAEFYQRARTLARALPDDDMASWSERVLPGWIKASQDSNTRPSPLDDAVLTEDSSAFSGVLSDADLISVDGAIGDELRRGALAELEETGALSVAPATGAPRAAAPVASLVADVADDGPTVVADAADLDLPRSGATDDALAGVESVLSDLPPESGAGPVTEPLPDARRTPVPAPDAPPGAAGARARFAPIRPTVVPRAASPAEGTGAGEPTQTALTAPAAPAAAPRVQRPSGPTLIPDEPFADEPAPAHGEAEPEGEAATVMMPVDREAAAAQLEAELAEEARTVPVHVPSDVDTVEARTLPLEAPVGEFEEEARTEPVVGASPGVAAPVVNPPERSPVDAPSAVDARRPVVEAAAQAAAEEPVAAPPAPVAAPAAPVAAPAAPVGPIAAPPAAPPKKKGSGLLAGLAAGCLVAVIGVGALGAVVALNLDSLRAAIVEAKTGAPPAPAPAAAAADGAPADEPEAAPPAGPALVFRSEDGETKKLKVRCGAAKGDGETEATVPVESAESCTVTAYMNDRSRRTAAVQKPTAGAYVCFAGDADRCERQ